MENQKRQRVDHSSVEYRTARREELGALKAKMSIRLNKIDAELVLLDQPFVKKERKPVTRKPSVTGLMKEAKSEFSPEELRQILENARRRKEEMGAI